MNAQRLCVAACLLVCAAAASADELPARLQWVQRVALGSPVSGVITEVEVAEGQRVPAQAILLRLDEIPLRARVAALEAQQLARRNDRDEARRELARNQELYDRTLLAEHDLTLAKIARDAAEAALKTTEAELTQARWELDHSRLRAPFEAWVVRRRAEPGQTVVSRLQAEPLLVLARAGGMLARARVPAEQLAGLRMGQRLTVRVAKRDYPGHIQRLALEADGQGRFAVDVRFDSGDRLLRAGLPASVLLP